MTIVGWQIATMCFAFSSALTATRTASRWLGIAGGVCAIAGMIATAVSA